jgi:2-oxoglutarate dehydrogenase E2 component (dihydrolipoamide succinyltransferase)
VVELETDKVTVEVPAPASGVISEILAKEGETVGIGALLGSISADAAQAAGGGKPAAAGAKPATAGAKPATAGAKPAAQPAPRAQAAPADQAVPAAQAAPAAPEPRAGDMPLAPSVRRIAAETGLDPAGVQGSGRGGRVTKGDMLAAAEASATAAAPAAYAPPQTPAPAPQPAPRAPSPPEDAAREERVRMTKLRQTIARRLKEAQNTAAMLTTFNDVDMKAVMDLRKEYKDLFEKKHGVKLGFMSFFVKACVQALKEIPAVNAEIDGNDLVYKNYYNIGVAVGTERGLVVPVLRDADRMSLADIEKAIADFGRRARDSALKIDEMQGGTFTISNGGVYGSLLSTPILNAPQSGILGMHRIEERPVVIKGQIAARPMMYLALSYDHRIVDGREAVTFLVRVKESIEDPQRLVLDL